MRSSPTQYSSSPMICAKYFGRVWMNGIATARPACTLGSCVAIQQKSSSRGSPQCSTTKFRSVKSVATWSTSATSNASRSSGRIVGPLCTWMLRMPSSRQTSK